MKFLTLFVLIAFGLPLAACQHTYNPLEGLQRTSLDANTPVAEAELPPVVGSEDFAQAIADHEVVVVNDPLDPSNLRGRWTLSDSARQVTCPLILYEERAQDPELFAAEAGASCFNRLFEIQGFIGLDNRIVLYDADRRILAWLQTGADGNLSGETASGLKIIAER